MLKDYEIYKIWSDTYKPMNIVSKVMGLTSIDFGKDKIVKLSKKRYYYNIVLIALFIIDFCYYVIWSILMKSSFSIKEATYAFSIASQSLIGIVSIISVATTPNRGINNFTKLMKCDCCLNRIGIVVPYKTSKKIMTISFFTGLSFYIIFFVTDYFILFHYGNKSELITLMSWISVKIHLLYSVAVQFQFLFIIGVIGLRFQLLNDAILKLSKTDNIKLNDINFIPSLYEQRLLKRISIKEKIRMIKTVHDTLLEVCEKFNIQVSIINLLNIGTNLIGLTTEIYSLINNVIDKSENNSPYNWLNIFYSCYWIIYRSIQIISLAATCAYTSYQANYIAVPIHKLIESGNAEEAFKELHNFSLQLIHRKLQFSACGFFPLNLSLLYAVTGTISTYLVILVQFKMSGMRV